jgi:hypothetical protein
VKPTEGRYIGGERDKSAPTAIPFIVLQAIKHAVRQVEVSAIQKQRLTDGTIVLDELFHLCRAC